MQTLIKRVEILLKEKKSCRDSDLSLCTEIWHQECLEMGSNFSDLSAVHFLHFISIGRLSKQQSILRSRRSLNNKKSETIGSSYKSNIVNAKNPSKWKNIRVVREAYSLETADYILLPKETPLIITSEKVRLAKSLIKTNKRKTDNTSRRTTKIKMFPP